VEPIANYMAQWSSCTKQQQDQALLNTYIYASRTKENFGKGCHYQVPFDASLVEEAGLKDLEEIKGAGVCESAFFIDVLPRKWPGMDDYQDKEAVSYLL
jgi:hypothetical protein